MSGLPSISIDSLPEEFFIDLAVGVNSFLDICDNYNIDQTTAEALKQDPKFERRFRIANQAVEDDGSAFRARCRTVVANNIDTVVNMMKDPDVAASVQLDAFKTLVKYGGLEPVNTQQTVSSGPGLVLNIIAPDGSQAVLGTPQPTQHHQPQRSVTKNVTIDGDFIESPDEAKPISAGAFASRVFGAA